MIPDSRDEIKWIFTPSFHVCCREKNKIAGTLDTCRLESMALLESAVPKRSLPYGIPGVRYELWLKGQDAIRRCSARGDAQVLKGFNQRGHHAVDPCGPFSQATMVIRSCAEEMGKLDSVAGKAALKSFF